MAKLGELLRWYEPRRTAYPWRRRPPDPYAVLVSEFMLQQTQAARVVAAFDRFVGRFPSVQALARAPLSDVLREWSGLGYNRRAAALSRTARIIVRDHGGRVPDDPTVLATLPGVGPYTASAVASLGYGRPVPAIDTNVRRVLARAILGVDTPHATGAALRAAAEEAIDRGDPGAWNQALMDVGREVCRRQPLCDRCPISRSCRFRREKTPRTKRTARLRPPYEGSFRQLRGQVIEALAGGPRSLEELASLTDRPPDMVTQAVVALAADGLADAGPTGPLGGAGAKVRLAEDP